MTKALSKKRSRGLSEKGMLLFRIHPIRVRAKDGSKDSFLMEFRTGPDGGSYTIESWLQRLGLEKEMASDMRVIQKLRDQKTKKRLYAATKTEHQKRGRQVFRSVRNRITEMSVSQGIIPVMEFIPLNGNVDEPRLFIQGWIREDDLKPVHGNLEHIATAIESRNSRIKNVVDGYRFNQRVAKAMMALPQVGKDLQRRLQRVVAGELNRLEFVKQQEG